MAQRLLLEKSGVTRVYQTHLEPFTQNQGNGKCLVLLLVQRVASLRLILLSFTSLVRRCLTCPSFLLGPTSLVRRCEIVIFNVPFQVPQKFLSLALLMLQHPSFVIGIPQSLSLLRIKSTPSVGRWSSRERGPTRPVTSRVLAGVTALN